MIATTVEVGTAIAAMVGLTRPVLYTATADVVIEPTDTSAFGFDPESGVFGADAATLETEMRVVRAPGVTRSVIDQLGLERRMANEIAAKEDEGATLAPALQPFARVLALVPTDILVATSLASEVVQLEVVDIAAEAPLMALEYLEEGLTIRQSGRSRVFSIGFTAESPAEAARVANALTDAYITQQLAQKVGGTSGTSSYLETRLEDLEEEVRAAEQAIKDYRADNWLIDMSGSSLSEQELSQLSNELINVRAQREDTQGRLAYIRGLRERGGDGLESVGDILQSPLVAILLQEHIRLKSREAELLSTFGDRHPQVVSVRADMEGAVRQIAGEAERYIVGLTNEISLLGAREAAIREQMERVTIENVAQAQAGIGLRSSIIAPKVGLQPDCCLVDYMVGEATLEEILFASVFDLTVVPRRREASGPVPAGQLAAQAPVHRAAERATRLRDRWQPAGAAEQRAEDEERGGRFHHLPRSPARSHRRKVAKRAPRTRDLGLQGHRRRAQPGRCEKASAIRLCWRRLLLQVLPQILCGLRRVLSGAGARNKGKTPNMSQSQDERWTLHRSNVVIARNSCGGMLRVMSARTEPLPEAIVGPIAIAPEPYGQARNAVLGPQRCHRDAEAIVSPITVTTLLLLTLHPYDAYGVVRSMDEITLLPSIDSAFSRVICDISSPACSTARQLIGTSWRPTAAAMAGA